ncbi:MAG: hypothetical protein H6721_23845 [Sandaracinus sp.]|nr:hypothetical protein [Sandaracinus sp.]MCB9613570.1 hypothetical protein [Sandaracinus sp.]MCB9635170.1 hypothetical protein [Sandaracinus sp.]
MTRFLPALALVFSLAASTASAQDFGLQLAPPMAVTAPTPMTATPAAPTSYRIVGEQERLSLQEMEHHRVEIRRLRSELPSFRAPIVFVAAGGALVLGSVLDVVRRGLRMWTSGWFDEAGDGHDPFEHSRAARVVGALGAGVVLTGLVLWRYLARARRQQSLEIRRLETALAER